MEHLFLHPFYFIEYGIAQIGALQLWIRSHSDDRATLSQYKTLLRLGGSRPLPALFDAAGLRFDLSKTMLADLVEAMDAELNSLGT